MARPAAPATLKLINGRSEGRDSGGRKVEPPPAFVRSTPRPPTWLPREAKAEWRRVVPGLAKLGLLKAEDRAALTVYCVTWARYVRAVREVERDGFTVPTETGGVKRNPALAVVDAATVQLRAFATEFGLTPAAESRLSRLPDGHHGVTDANPFA